MRRARFCTAGILCIFATHCFAEIAQAKTKRTGAGAISPSSVVREYCKLDIQGARLSSDNPDIEKYFTLVAWPDEPGWDGAVLIKDFAITHLKLEQSQSTVTVR